MALNDHFNKTVDDTYLPSNSIAISKTKLLSDVPTMYSGGSMADGYWVKFSNGIGFFFKTADVTFGNLYNANAASFYRWTCDASTNTTVRDNFIPKGIKFIQEPIVWMWASNGISPDGGGVGVVGSTSINVNGIAFDTNDATYGYVPRTFTLNVNDKSLASCTLSCFAIGVWKTSSSTNSANKFLSPANGAKWASDSIAFSSGAEPLTLKDMILRNTVDSFVGDLTSGYVRFTDGLTISWQKITTGTMTATAGAKGYIKSCTPTNSFPCSYLFPPAVFVNSTTYRHIPMSVYGTSTTNIGKIVFSGTNETNSMSCGVLALGMSV